MIIQNQFHFEQTINNSVFQQGKTRSSKKNWVTSVLSTLKSSTINDKGATVNTEASLWCITNQVHFHCG